MEIITSTQNEWITEARKLKQKKYREISGYFLAEGLRLCEEAMKAAVVREVYYHESLADTPRGSALLQALATLTSRFFKVSVKVMDTLAETNTPQGIVCVCKRNQDALKLFQPLSGPVVVADGIQDPGNLGTILRTIWAAGGKGLVCLRGTTDPYNGKCIRASMGGVFHVPVFPDCEWQTVARWALERSYHVVATDAAHGKDYRRILWPDNTLLCIGSEAAGLTSIPLQEAAECVSIPLAQSAESLNAAVAAGILLFAMNRNPQESGSSPNVL